MRLISVAEENQRINRVMMRFVCLCVLGGVLATMSTAADLALSPRPLARPTTQVIAPVPPSASMAQSPIPRPRPTHIDAAAKKRAGFLAKGAVCGDIGIQGVPIGRVAAKVNGCGVQDAVKISSIAGVKLSQKSVMDCGTAKALKTWIEGGAKPAIGSQGGGLDSLQIMGHYACRPRNNQKGEKISEHGRGRAIDIGGFTLKNGRSFTVLKDWSGSKWSDELAKMHRAACGPFGTVLGPRANSFHKNHFHFDTARYRSGSYCK